MAMQSSNRTELQRSVSSDNVWADCGSLSKSGCLQFFCRQLMRKWLQFKPTGDDFGADGLQPEDDSPVPENEVFSTCSPAESIYGGSENSLRRSSSLPPELLVPDGRRGSCTLAESETVREQFVDNTGEYCIAVGTWNAGGRPPPREEEELDMEGDIDEWLDSKEEADIYVLGFQEIVPLNTGNVLGVEDQGPAAKWETLIRQVLNNKPKSSSSSQAHSRRSAPQKLQRGLSVVEVPEKDIDRITGGPASEDSICSPLESELQKGASSQHLKDDYSKSGSKRPYILTPKEGASVQDRGISHGDETFERMSQRGSVDERSPVYLGLDRSESLNNWSLKRSISGASEGCPSILEREESLETPLFRPSGESRISRTFSRDSSQSISRYSRIASKQMAGLFVTIWVRKELRRHVHNVEVSCVGCGLMGYLGNKGSISVSLSLYETSLCFICAHLTSGNKEGDENRRNSDVAEILRRTSFPRSSNSLKLPETITSHDCMIWLGDLNYRLALPDLEVRSLVGRGAWDALLEKDELKIEQNAGRVLVGWQEGPIRFPPTYKYCPNSCRYSGEGAKPGERILRTPAWCDRILCLGGALRETSYVRTESRLSDHRPVRAVFVAEVERCSHHKLKSAVVFASPASSMTAEDISDSPDLSSIRSFPRLPLNEMKDPTMPDQCFAASIVSEKRKSLQSFKDKLQREGLHRHHLHSFKGKLQREGPHRHHLPSVF